MDSQTDEDSKLNGNGVCKVGRLSLGWDETK